MSINYHLAFYFVPRPGTKGALGLSGIPSIPQELTNYAYEFDIDGNFSRAELTFEYDTKIGSIGKNFEPRIYYIDNQLFAIFLYLVILLFFTCYLLDSTLLVHFDIPNFLVSLQNKKTSENKRVNDFTRFDTHLGT